MAARAGSQNIGSNRSKKIQNAAQHQLQNLNGSSSDRPMTSTGFSQEAIQAYMEKMFARQQKQSADLDAQTKQYHNEQKAAMQQDRKEILSAVNGVSATQKVYIWYCQCCFSWQLRSVDVLPFPRIHVSPAAL